MYITCSPVYMQHYALTNVRPLLNVNGKCIDHYIGAVWIVKIQRQHQMDNMVNHFAILNGTQLRFMATKESINYIPLSCPLSKSVKRQATLV